MRKTRVLKSTYTHDKPTTAPTSSKLRGSLVNFSLLYLFNYKLDYNRSTLYILHYGNDKSACSGSSSFSRGSFYSIARSFLLNHVRDVAELSPLPRVPYFNSSSNGKLPKLAGGAGISFR